MKFLLSIAGFDPTGGAGILKDVKVFSELGFDGGGVVTALTIQNQKKVFGAVPLSPGYVKEALNHIDVPIAGLKTGMLYSEDIVMVVSEFIRRHEIKPVVVDPVILSSSGFKLLEESGILEMKGHLFSRATFITPNYTEGKILTGEIDPELILEKLKERGPEYVILKMGEEEGIDLFFDGDRVVELTGKKIEKGMHGTGCTHSSALLCYLVSGYSPLEAAKKAKVFTEQKIEM